VSEDIVDDEPLPAPIVLLLLEPEGVVPLAVVELEPVEPLPVAAAPLPVVAAAPLPVGVPVAPMGVDWVLCWPAPTAGSLAAGLGGVP
jgi:hypothetical protein